jgi:hypothetical protein
MARYAAPLSLTAGGVVAVSVYLAGLPDDWLAFAWNAAFVCAALVIAVGFLTSRAAIVAVGLVLLGAMLYAAMQ